VDIRAVVETAIYVDDLRATETFSGTVLGLRVMSREPGRHVFFRVGESSALLAFLAEALASLERGLAGWFREQGVEVERSE
jgi:catechol 2,3-dioxygenase-like lactoylglutathione lyase family enzyme